MNLNILLDNLKTYCKEQENSKTLLNYYSFLRKLAYNSKSLRTEDIKFYLENNLKDKKEISKTKSGLKMFCTFYKNDSFDFSIFDDVAKNKPRYSNQSGSWPRFYRCL